MKTKKVIETKTVLVGTCAGCGQEKKLVARVDNKDYCERCGMRLSLSGKLVQIL